MRTGRIPSVAVSRLPAQTGKRDQASGLTPWILMLSVITVAIPSTSTTAERGIEMFNIAAAAANLAARRIRTARTKLHWSQEAFAGVCGLERSYYGGVSSAASEMSHLRFFV
jgi:hypothetical protein